MNRIEEEDDVQTIDQADAVRMQNFAQSSQVNQLPGVSSIQEIVIWRVALDIVINGLYIIFFFNPIHWFFWRSS